MPKIWILFKFSVFILADSRMLSYFFEHYYKISYTNISFEIVWAENEKSGMLHCEQYRCDLAQM